jgi:tartrate dehydrogenase/decarboxylase/D-malate dehydrogenase
MRHAIELAKTRKKHVSSATKSNGISHMMPFWAALPAAVAGAHPDIRPTSATSITRRRYFVRHSDGSSRGRLQTIRGHPVRPGLPVRLDRQHALGQHQPERALDVRAGARRGADAAGRGIAHLFGQIWSGAMMLGIFGETDAAAALERHRGSPCRGGTRGS